MLRDHLGSTRVSVRSDGTSGVGYSYDALGNLIDDFRFGIDDSNTPLLNRPSEIQNRQSLSHRYTGQEFDNETGLHNFRARLYDSDLFRFYATDPAGQQHSPYAFVGNSPLMFRDPTGMILDPFTAALIFAGFNALSSGAMAASSGKDFWGAAGRSLLGSAISMGVSAGVGGIFDAAFGYAGTTLSAAGEVAGIAPLQFGLSGAISGGINAGLNGGNVLQGALLGGGLGALSGAGYYSQYQDRIRSSLLTDVIYKNQHGQEVFREARAGKDIIINVNEIYSYAWDETYFNQYGKPSTTLENFATHFSGKIENQIITGEVSYLGYKFPNKIESPYDFIQLDKGPEIDMVHFMVVGRRGETLGTINEIKQTGTKSAFYPQDLYSNKLGVKFFDRYSDVIAENPSRISEYIRWFLSNRDNW